MATRQASVELAKEQRARAADAEAARSALLAAQQALHEEKTARRDAEASASKQLRNVQIELATQRERTAGAELRANDIASQLQRQQAQHEREIARLRESQAAAAAALRQLEARDKSNDKTNETRSRRSAKGSDR
jgi:hypothetical protein